MTNTYRRAVFVAPRQIRIDELPIPEPGPRQALIRVRACGLCTWEQRMYTGEEPYYPLAGGHEVAGELVKLGSKVFTDAKIGDQVVASLLTRCGYCESCRKGLDSICDNARAPFFDTDVPGPAGLAEYVLLDDYQLYKGANDIPFEELCLTEPLACVVRSVRKARLERGENVLIIGAGIMGMLHLVLVKQAGVRVMVSEPNAPRAAFAKELGADLVFNPLEQDLAESVREATNGRGVDVVFCATAIGALVEQAVNIAAKGGRVMVYSSIHPRGTKITVDPNIFHNKEVTLTGTVSQDRGDVWEAVRLIIQRKVDLKPFVSRVLPFEKLEEGFQEALKLDTYRVVVTM